jgi:cytochrome c-type biogenesis protein CcmH/NrfG
VHNHLGLAYAAAERHGDALREFERAVAIDCDNRAAQANLARARAHAGN